MAFQAVGGFQSMKKHGPPPCGMNHVGMRAAGTAVETGFASDIWVSRKGGPWAGQQPTVWAASGKAGCVQNTELVVPQVGMQPSKLTPDAEPAQEMGN